LATAVLRRAWCSSVWAALLLAPAFALSQTETERFDVDRYEVVGNTLLPAREIEEVLRPFTGKRREYGDVQRALEVLELRYRTAGFSAVQVSVPEQELGKGAVRLNVIEARIGRIVVEGNKAFSEANVRASLPALKAGSSPRASDISANVQLANENPSKQVDVVLRLAEKEGEVEARVAVVDSDPLKVFATLDDTGNSQTGYYRAGVGVQYANLFDRDHVATLNYITSPKKTSEVKIYSASYRLPVYSLGDSIDVILAHSDVDAGVTETTLGALAFSGKGDVFGLRYNQLLSRSGEYSHRLVYALDRRAYKNVCTLILAGGVSAACGGAPGASVTVQPASLTYSGNWAAPGRVSDFNLGYSANIPGGSNGKDKEFGEARPSNAPGEPGAKAHYSIARAGASHVGAFAGDWQLRGALTAQLTSDALVPGEQFGVAGANAVRGFLEREVARDKGYIATVELYTPNLADTLVANKGALRALAFYDVGSAQNNPLAGETDQKTMIASVGAGLRWAIEKSFSLRFDVARVQKEAASKKQGDYRGHLALYYGF